MTANAEFSPVPYHTPSNPVPRVPMVLRAFSQLNELPMILTARCVTKGCTLQTQTKVDVYKHTDNQFKPADALRLAKTKQT